MIGELSHLALAQLLFLSTVFGFFAGALYDVFRIRRIALKIPILWHFEDFFFMVFCGVTYAVLFYALNSGRVRGFAFLGGIVGFYIYRKTLGRLVMALSERIINAVKYILRKIILPPIKFVVRMIKRALGAVVHLISLIFGRIYLKIEGAKTKKQLKAFAQSALYGFMKK